MTALAKPGTQGTQTEAGTGTVVGTIVITLVITTVTTGPETASPGTLVVVMTTAVVMTGVTIGTANQEGTVTALASLQLDKTTGRNKLTTWRKVLVKALVDAPQVEARVGAAPGIGTATVAGVPPRLVDQGALITIFMLTPMTRLTMPSTWKLQRHSSHHLRNNPRSQRLPIQPQ